MKRVAVFFVLFVLAASISAEAAQVTLAWDANQVKPDGYRVFARLDRESYNYSSPAWSGTETTCTISDLANGAKYHFVCRAFKGTDESGNSNEVEFAVNTPPMELAEMPTEVGSGQADIFDGGDSSDPENGFNVLHQWSQIFPAAPQGIIADPTSSVTGWTAPTVLADTTVVILHRVTDALGASDATSYPILVRAPSPPPTAIITGPAPIVMVNGIPTMTLPKGPFQLSGSASTPAGGTFSWTQLSGITVALSGANTPTLTVSSPSGVMRVYKFRLTYSRNNQTSSMEVVVKCIQ
jgi:hypothetical protein